MNAAVGDFRITGDTSKKIPKIKFEDYLNTNIEIVPDILREVSESKKQNQVFVGFCAFTGSITNARESIQKKLRVLLIKNLAH